MNVAVLATGGRVDAGQLPRRFADRRRRAEHAKSFGATTRAKIELAAIHEALERHGGSKPKAAEQLGVSLKTLYNKLNQHQAQKRAG